MGTHNCGTQTTHPCATYRTYSETCWYHKRLGFAAHGKGKLQLQKAEGTPEYLSPRILLAYSFKEPYGAEVDAYSTAMLLLKMIDLESFETMHAILPRPDGKKDCFGIFLSKMFNYANDKKKEGINDYGESTYLNQYLNAAGTNSKIHQELNKLKNADVKNLIDLSFQVSAGGKRGTEAFSKWEMAFEAWQKKEGLS